MYNEAVRPCRFDVTERERERERERGREGERERGREGGRKRGVMTQNFNGWKL